MPERSLSCSSSVAVKSTNKGMRASLMPCYTVSEKTSVLMYRAAQGWSRITTAIRIPTQVMIAAARTGGRRWSGTTASSQRAARPATSSRPGTSRRRSWPASRPSAPPHRLAAAARTAAVATGTAGGCSAAGGDRRLCAQQSVSGRCSAGSRGRRAALVRWCDCTHADFGLTGSS